MSRESREGPCHTEGTRAPGTRSPVSSIGWPVSIPVLLPVRLSHRRWSHLSVFDARGRIAERLAAARGYERLSVMQRDGGRPAKLSRKGLRIRRSQVRSLPGAPCELFSRPTLAVRLQDQ